jgi:hypothetical protein
MPSRPQPATKVGGARIVTRSTRKEQLPPLSAPFPPSFDTMQDSNMEYPDMTDIQMTTAESFLTFARQDKVQAMRVTWDELDRAAKPKPALPCRTPVFPDIPDEVYRRVLRGEGDPVLLRPLFPDDCQDFITTCYTNDGERLSRVTEADINKFLAGKPELTEVEIKAKLPEWLRDLSEGFLPQKADELPPRRPWDHKIEIVPGKEPPSRRTDRFRRTS